MNSYLKKLRDPRWQKKRLEKLDAAKWACEVCFDSENPLHVHHKQYIRGRDPWQYDDNQLAVLCESCHRAIHHADDFLLDVISRAPLDGPNSRDDLAFLIAGILNVKIRPMCLGHVAMFNIGRDTLGKYFESINALLDAHGSIRYGDTQALSKVLETESKTKRLAEGGTA